MISISFRTPYDKTKTWGVCLFYIEELAVYLAFSAAFCFYPAIFICPGLYLEAFCDHIIHIFSEIDLLTQNGKHRTEHEVNVLLRDAIQYQVKTST